MGARTPAYILPGLDKQSGIVAHAASHISQLLAAYDDDDNPFLTSDDNENERNDC